MIEAGRGPSGRQTRGSPRKEAGRFPDIKDLKQLVRDLEKTHS